MSQEYREAQWKAREEVAKDGWRMEIEAKKAGLWKDLIQIVCPECSRKPQGWPKAFAMPVCGDCWMHHGRRPLMVRADGKRKNAKQAPLPPPAPPEPRPKPVKQADILAALDELRAEVSRLNRRIDEGR